MWQVAKRFAPARLLALVVMISASTCASTEGLAKLQDELNGLKQMMGAQLSEQRLAIAILREEDKKIWRNIRCTDPQVADFMIEAEQCQTGQCPQRNLDRVLGFMASQKHVLVRLRPNQTAADIAPPRISQLRDLLEARQLTGVSRILMLTMQLNLGHDDPADLAERQADGLLMHTRRTLQLASSVPRVGPFPVTCQNKLQLLEGYGRKFPADRAVAGEPKSKEPQVAIWIFKVDC